MVLTLSFDDWLDWTYRIPMPYEAPNLAKLTLSDIKELVAARKLPPVESWEPANTGDSEMRIASDGKWFHQGGEITRPAMIRAFSSLLRRDADGQYWLVTPQQKLSIIVDDVPFIAVELQSEGKGQNSTLAFRLNSDDLVFADADHAIEMRNGMLYLYVREGLWAKLARPVYYELANLALAENPEFPCIWSKGAQFYLAAPA